MMHQFEVGKLYQPGRTSWPETTQYNFRSGSHELILFVNRPRSEEISSVGRGPCEFALFVEQPVIIFVYRFLPGLPWGDAPYSIHLVREKLGEEAATVPEIPSPFLERHLLLIHLVDATTGILRVNRAVTLSPAFTAELHRAIREQAELPWDARAFDAKLNRLYDSFTSDDLVARAIIKCQGGKDA